MRSSFECVLITRDGEWRGGGRLCVIISLIMRITNEYVQVSSHRHITDILMDGALEWRIIRH